MGAMSAISSSLTAISNEIVEYLRGLIPSKVECTIGGIAGVLGMIVDLLFGGWSQILTLLCLCMAIDYFTGVMAAGFSKRAQVSSKIGAKGIAKKVGILCVVMVGHFVDVMTSENVFCLLVAYFYIGNESISILENAARMGVPIPVTVVRKLKQVSGMEENEKEGNKK